jgi:glycerate kinase
MVPDRFLIAAAPWAGLPADRVAQAIARGALAAGMAQPDLCPLAEQAEPKALLDALGFDARMHTARAVVLAVACLAEETLAGSAAFEIATRARQGGVPAYAVTAENRLNAFDARMLDLQTIVQARDARALARAGRKLAQLA